MSASFIWPDCSHGPGQAQVFVVGPGGAAGRLAEQLAESSFAQMGDAGQFVGGGYVLEPTSYSRAAVRPRSAVCPRTGDIEPEVNRGSQLPLSKKRARPVHLSVHRSIARGWPFGDDSWTARMARRHGLESTLSRSLAAKEGCEEKEE